MARSHLLALPDLLDLEGGTRIDENFPWRPWPQKSQPTNGSTQDDLWTHDVAHAFGTKPSNVRGHNLKPLPARNKVNQQPMTGLPVVAHH